ncbi:MAG: geranylgeranyl reductase family protein [Actinomycetota bacterium]
MKPFTSPGVEPARDQPEAGANGKVTEVDVLVVGAGPGGAAAAHHLARHGIDVLAIDKARFPREKVCGDGLTPRGVAAIQRMGVEATEAGFVRIEGLRVYGPTVVLELPWPRLESLPDYGVVRTRHDLDHMLVQRAVKSGATVWEGTEALGPVVDDGWVVGARVKRDDGETETVRARYVLASDGAASRFAQKAGVRRDPTRPLGVAARRYVRSPRPQTPWFESWFDLWQNGVILPGYGWIFPVGDGLLNVGAGLLNTTSLFKEISPRKMLDVFEQSLPEEWEIVDRNAEGDLLSGPLPMGMNRRPLAMPGLLLVGDAGGLVNPFTGEGIAYAMESAEVAAELVYDALDSGRPGLAHVYPVEMKRRYGGYFTVGRAFARAIGNPRFMRLSVLHAFPRERLMRFALRMLANLTDGREGDLDDRLMDWIVRIAPQR